MATLDVFAGKVLALRGLSDVPPDLMHAAVAEVFTRFCTVAPIWTKQFCVDLQQGVARYPLEIPSDTVVRKVESVMQGCRVLSSNLIDRHRGYSFDSDTQELVLGCVAAADEPNGLEVEVSIMPSTDLCDVPKGLLAYWQDDIADAAAAKLFMVAGQSWFNASLAQLYDRKVRAAQVRMRNVAVQQRVAGPIRMKGNRF